MVMAGIKPRRMCGRNLFNWSRLARLESKNSCGQKAANPLARRKAQMKTYPLGLPK
jgi:hypothetical protein